MKILLVCAGGMSSSILCLQIQEACKERMLEHEVIAVDYTSIKKYAIKADVILIAPQIANYITQIKEIAREDTKVGLIESTAYGLMDGKKILNDIMKLYDMGCNDEQDK